MAHPILPAHLRPTVLLQYLSNLGHQVGIVRCEHLVVEVPPVFRDKGAASAVQLLRSTIGSKARPLSSVHGHEVLARVLGHPNKHALALTVKKAPARKTAKPGKVIVPVFFVTLRCKAYSDITYHSNKRLGKAKLQGILAVLHDYPGVKGCVESVESLVTSLADPQNLGYLIDVDIELRVTAPSAEAAKSIGVSLCGLEGVEVYLGDQIPEAGLDSLEMLDKWKVVDVKSASQPIATTTSKKPAARVQSVKE